MSNEQIFHGKTLDLYTLAVMDYNAGKPPRDEFLTGNAYAVICRRYRVFRALYVVAIRKETELAAVCGDPL